MLTLFYAPRTRSNRPRWALEELGVPYELVRLDMAEGEHRSPEYLEIHPLGLVPALQDGDRTIIESAAICMYLADRFPEKGLAPPPVLRGIYHQWCIYTVVTLEEPLVQIFTQTVRLPPEQRSLMAEMNARERASAAIFPLERMLSGQEYALASGFSMVDILLAGVLWFGENVGALYNRPACQAYVRKCRSRPAYARAIAD